MSEREWSYQVGHGSCGLYVTEVIYRELESKGHRPRPATGGTDPSAQQDALQGLQPLQEAEGLNRGEKKVREVED